jgi:hypothetical protein
MLKSFIQTIWIGHFNWEFTHYFYAITKYMLLRINYNLIVKYKIWIQKWIVEKKQHISIVEHKLFELET